MSTFMYPSYLSETEQEQYRAFVRTRAPLIPSAKDLVREDQDLIDAEYWNRLRLFLGKARVTSENLAIAASGIAEEDRQQKVTEAAEEKRRQEYQVWVDQTPGVMPLNAEFAKIIDEYMSTHPDASAQDWDTYVRTAQAENPSIWRNPQTLADLVNKVRVADKAQLARLMQQYGEDKVRKALEKLAKSIHESKTDDRRRAHQTVEEKTQNAKNADAARAKQESDPREIAKAEEMAEFLASSIRISGNHADNAIARQAVAEIVITKVGENGIETDWFATYQKRQAYVDRITSTSIR